MYKNTSESGNYLKRVASHSTKESPTGLIKAVPAWAAEPEEYYNSLKEQYSILQEMIFQVLQDLRWVDLQLTNTLPFEEFKRHDERRTRLVGVLNHLKAESGELRVAVRAAGENAWGICWRLCAKRRLPVDLFATIEADAAALMGRNEFEMRSHENRSDEDKKRRHRLQQLREKLNGMKTKRRAQQRARAARREK